MSTVNQAPAPTTQMMIQLSQPGFEEVYDNCPDVFVHQAKQGKAQFELDADLVSGANYGGSAATDFFRIVIEDPALMEDGVSFKIRLSGIMDWGTGEMVPMARGSNNLRGDQNWLRGFRSDRRYVTTEDVQNGLISESDYNVLVKYAESWAQIVERDGDRAPYSKAHSKHRLWLTAAGPDFLFLFLMELRQDPNTGYDVLGITDVCWRDAALIGVGSGAPPKRVSIARRGPVSTAANDLQGPPRLIRTGFVEEAAVPKKAETTVTARSRRSR